MPRGTPHQPYKPHLHSVIDVLDLFYPRIRGSQTIIQQEMDEQGHNIFTSRCVLSHDVSPLNQTPGYFIFKVFSSIHGFSGSSHSIFTASLPV